VDDTRQAAARTLWHFTMSSDGFVAGPKHSMDWMAGSRSAVWAPWGGDGPNAGLVELSTLRVSRMWRWLRPRDTSGHDGPRDAEGEPP
jgi:hypothetical protein